VALLGSPRPPSSSSFLFACTNVAPSCRARAGPAREVGPPTASAPTAAASSCSSSPRACSPPLFAALALSSASSSRLRHRPPHRPRAGSTSARANSASTDVLRDDGGDPPRLRRPSALAPALTPPLSTRLVVEDGGRKPAPRRPHGGGLPARSPRHSQCASPCPCSSAPVHDPHSPRSSAWILASRPTPSCRWRSPSAAPPDAEAAAARHFSFPRSSSGGRASRLPGAAPSTTAARRDLWAPPRFAVATRPLPRIAARGAARGVPQRPSAHSRPRASVVRGPATSISAMARPRAPVVWVTTLRPHVGRTEGSQSASPRLYDGGVRLPSLIKSSAW